MIAIKETTGTNIMNKLIKMITQNSTIFLEMFNSQNTQILLIIRATKLTKRAPVPKNLKNSSGSESFSGKNK